MSHETTSDTMQAYLAMLLAGEDSLGAPQNGSDDGEEKVSGLNERKSADPDAAISPEKAENSIGANRDAGASAPKTNGKQVNGSTNKLTKASTVQPVSHENGKPAQSKVYSPEEKQQRQLESDTGTGRRLVPPLKETEALREEQKRRLQKLLSQQSLSVTQKTDVPVPPPKVVEEIVNPIPAPIPEKPALSEKISASDLDDDATDIDGTFHSAMAHKLEWHENGRPHWGQERFDALLFDVSGLTLAVPLVALGQIVRIEKGELTPIFGQTDWFMGLLESNVGRLRVINTALFVMPEKYDARFLDSAEYAISLDGVRWALAVDRVNQPISLDPTEIKWRTERSKRPWLAGTVKSQMCALLDIPQMASLLNKSDKAMSSS